MANINRKRVGIWIRVSTERQAQGDSPEVHEHRARAYAESKDWEVVEVYHLESISGKSVANQGETLRMLADIKSGHIEALIFSKIARFARNTKELLEFSDIFQSYNADMISLGESIDTSSPAGRLFFTIISALAQWEREEIAERVALSVPVRAKMGKSLGGRAPFGYQWNEHKQLVIHEEEATIRRYMYDLFLKHKRKRTVARLLNEQGYTTRNGGMFSDTSIMRLLSDSIAKGVRRMNYTSLRTGDYCIKDEEDWVYMNVPAIIVEEKWERVQAIIKEQSDSRAKPLKTNLHLFTNIAHCRCGGKMYVLSKTSKYVCKSCKQKIPSDILESIFQDQLHSFALDEKSLDTLLEQDNKYRNAQEQLLHITDREILKTEKTINALFSLHEQGQIETADFKTRYQEPREQLTKLKEQKADIEHQLHINVSKKVFHEKMFTILKDVYGNWSTLDKAEKRNIIEAMTESIIVHQDEVEIVLKQLSPLLSENVTFEPHTPMGSLLKCEIHLKAPRPRDYCGIDECANLGEYIRRTRFHRNEYQRFVAHIIGVTTDTITNWELGRNVPLPHHTPKILSYLGYTPLFDVMGTSTSKRLKQFMYVHGLKQTQCATLLGIDPETVGKLERGEQVRTSVTTRVHEQVEALLFL